MQVKLQVGVLWPCLTCSRMATFSGRGRVVLGGQCRAETALRRGQWGGVWRDLLTPCTRCLAGGPCSPSPPLVCLSLPLAGLLLQAGKGVRPLLLLAGRAALTLCA